MPHYLCQDCIRLALLRYALLLVACLVASDAAAERFGIHFVASAHSLHTDSVPNNNFLSSASRVRWDVYLPADINENGFVTIDGPRVRLRNIAGQVEYRSKNGVGGDCSGDFSAFDPVNAPSSVELVRLSGNLAYIRIRAPHTSRLFKDGSKSGTFCESPRFPIYATFPDGTPLAGSSVTNVYFPNPYMMDGPSPATNVDNHYMYAEFPVNISTPTGGSYGFSFSHTGTDASSSIRMVWFGRITLVRDDGSPPPAVDGYTLGGYLPPTNFGSEPPPDPPANLGGGTGGDPGPTPTKSPIVSWIKDAIDSLLKGVMNALRSGNTSNVSFVTLRAVTEVGETGSFDIDSGTSTVTVTSVRAAPFSGTLTVNAKVLNPKTGKSSTVRLPSIQVTANQGVSFGFSSRKLARLLAGKGKRRITFSYGFKPQGIKKVFTATTKIKL